MEVQEDPVCLPPGGTGATALACTAPAPPPPLLPVSIRTLNQDNGVLGHVPFHVFSERGKSSQAGASTDDSEHLPQNDDDALISRFLGTFLKPSQRYSNQDVPIITEHFTLEELLRIVAMAQTIVASEPTLVEVEGPSRLVSDLHGQYPDLMRLFSWWGKPDGQVTWIFLGDYVDRYQFSLEVMFVLYALKLQHPDKIILLRGNHEIHTINHYYGFHGECTLKYGQEGGHLLWRAINDSFDYLPLAAVVSPGPAGHPTHPTRYMCVHGGIGRVATLEEIKNTPRPIVEFEAPQTATAAHQLLADLVWSDPAASDDAVGIGLSKRDAHSGRLCTYGMDVVDRFCRRNNITAIIRGHECIQEGLELAFNNRVITFFSAVNYTGTAMNHGCIIDLVPCFDKDRYLQLVPHPMRIEARDMQSEKPLPPPHGLFSGRMKAAAAAPQQSTESSTQGCEQVPAADGNGQPPLPQMIASFALTGMSEVDLSLEDEYDIEHRPAAARVASSSATKHGQSGADTLGQHDGDQSDQKQGTKDAVRECEGKDVARPSRGTQQQDQALRGNTINTGQVLGMEWPALCATPPRHSRNAGPWSNA